MAEVVTVDMEQLQRCVRVLLVANVPGALWGPPGGGKTAIVEQITASLKAPEGGSWRLFTLILSLLEQSDLSGIPYPDTMDGGRKIARYLPPACLLLAEIYGDIHSVLLVDEFDRAEPGLQNSSLQLLSQRQVHDKPLSRNCRILLAGNGTTDSLTSGLSEAAATRMCHLYIDNRADNTLRSWQRWATTKRRAPGGARLHGVPLADLPHRGRGGEVPGERTAEPADRDDGERRAGDGRRDARAPAVGRKPEVHAFFNKEEM